MSHSNISIFVPHLGCLHRCSFCDQNSITGTATLPFEADVDKAVKLAVKSKNYSPQDTEIAFFGGSFTAIDTDYMNRLLNAAYIYVKNGTVKGIRISTRPDCIDECILKVLKSYGVTSIELGAQSMCDEVLTLNHRGHTADAVRNASALIKSFGFSLGLQMMTGLYGSNKQLDRLTAGEIIALKPDTVRIYPAITLKNTLLARLFNEGKYLPPTLDDSVTLCAELIEEFQKNDISVIRVGLHSIDEAAYVAGPWHPAFKELCDSKRYFDIITRCLEDKPKGDYLIYVAKGELSKAIGNKRINLEKLKSLGYICRVTENQQLKPFSVIPERMNNSCI